MKLNSRLTIQKMSKNGTLKNNTFEDYKTLWAKVTNLHGKEFLQAQSLNADISKKVTIRYLKELDSSLDKNVSKKFRIKYKENYYNILYADNIKEENRFIELMLKGE